MLLGASRLRRRPFALFGLCDCLPAAFFLGLVDRPLLESIGTSSAASDSSKRTSEGFEGLLEREIDRLDLFSAFDFAGDFSRSAETSLDAVLTGDFDLPLCPSSATSIDLRAPPTLAALTPVALFGLGVRLAPDLAAVVFGFALMGARFLGLSVQVLPTADSDTSSKSSGVCDLVREDTRLVLLALGFATVTSSTFLGRPRRLGEVVSSSSVADTADLAGDGDSVFLSSAAGAFALFLGGVLLAGDVSFEVFFFGAAFLTAFVAATSSSAASFFADCTAFLGERRKVVVA